MIGSSALTGFASGAALRGLGRRLATVLGFGLALGGVASAQTIPLSQAPPAWVRYAESATGTITGWLREESETGVRLRAYLEGTREAEGQPTPPLMLRLWIGADGAVTRVEFTPFAHDEANNDIRSLVVGRKLPSAPPADMRQPMLLGVQLDARPAEPATTTPSAKTDQPTPLSK